jgi:hypothetical protein
MLLAHEFRVTENQQSSSDLETLSVTLNSESIVVQRYSHDDNSVLTPEDNFMDELLDGGQLRSNEYEDEFMMNNPSILRSHTPLIMKPFSPSDTSLKEADWTDQTQDALKNTLTLHLKPKMHPEVAFQDSR